MTSLPKVTKEFLEDLINKEITHFTIQPGTNIGDNYMSIMCSFEIKLLTGETYYLIAKCLPTDPARQAIMVNSNMFWNELNVYKTLIPALNDMALNAGIHDGLNFPPFIGGKAPNFRDTGEKRSKDATYEPLDAFIMMTDVRKTFGFVMEDRKVGLSLDHVVLVIKAYAKLHAYSWIYKQLHGLETLETRFACLANMWEKSDLKMWSNILQKNVLMAIDTLQSVFGTDSALVHGARRIESVFELIVSVSFYPKLSIEEFASIHRVKPIGNKGSKSWKVLLHGDGWTNNLLFRYNPETGKPQELTMVDLQGISEHCPTFDLAYFLYSSTTTEFRKNHVDEVLELYYNEFNRHCELFSVEPLPNFTLNELKRKFHLTKIFGFLMATSLIPVMLKDAKDIPDLNTLKGDSFADVLSNEFPTKSTGLYSERLCALTAELYDEGVL